MPDLAGKIALIHGAGREPARSVALALAAQGVGLALCDLTPMAVEQTADTARTLGARVTCHIADPSKGLAARMLLDEVLEAWEGLDFLVLHPRAEPRKPLLILDEWDWHRTLESNLNAPFLMMQLVGGWLVENGRSGVILNLITCGQKPPGDPQAVAYYTSQMGLRALTRAAAAEFAGHGIQLYGIAVDDFSPARMAETAQVCIRLCRQDPPVEAGRIYDLSQEGD